MSIKVKRAYDPPQASDGRRLLVDRIWPRGVKKDDLHLDGWVKEVAPSTQLRKWYGHDPAKWASFQSRYFRELAEQPDAVKSIRAQARKGSVTLVFAARDVQHSHAVALKNYLEDKQTAFSRRGKVARQRRKGEASPSAVPKARLRAG